MPSSGGVHRRQDVGVKLKTGEVVTTMPTTGGIVETVEYKDLSLTAWDVESQGKCWLLRRTEGVQQSVDRGRNARYGGDGFFPLSRN